MDTGELLLRTARAVNELSAQLMVTSMAVEELIKSLPQSERTDIASRLRQRVDRGLTMHKGSGDMQMEGAATLQLAALLEAAGHPPKR